MIMLLSQASLVGQHFCLATWQGLMHAFLQCAYLHSPGTLCSHKAFPDIVGQLLGVHTVAVLVSGLQSILPPYGITTLR